MSKRCAPLPISSSGVKPTRIVGARQLRVRREVRDRGHHLGHAGLVVGAEQRVAARVTRSWPDLRAQLGHRARDRAPSARAAARSARRRSRGARAARRPPRTRPGLVSRCASRPITGAPGTLPASVAKTKPFASCATSVSPAPRSSSTSRRPSSSWPGVLGDCGVRAVGLGVDADVAQQPLQHVGRERGGQIRGVRRGAGRRHARPCSHADAVDDRVRAAAAACAGRRAARGAACKRVIDVRFRPQSRRPGMSKTRLGDMLGDHGIAYEHRKALGHAARPAPRLPCGPDRAGARGLPRARRGDRARRAGRPRRRARARAAHGAALPRGGPGHLPPARAQRAARGAAAGAEVVDL